MTALVRLRRFLILQTAVHIGVALLFCGGVLAQSGKAASGAGVAQRGTRGVTASLSPDALGAKAFLEGLLVKRYALELATIIHRDSFSLGAQLELTPVGPPPVVRDPVKVESEPLSDLLLGSLDADQLLRAYAGPVDERTLAQRFMENFRIRAVTVSVGLSESLGEQAKTEVEAWLKKRLIGEFGSAGKGLVTMIKMPLAKREDYKEKTPWDWLGEFQSLAGQAVIALAILIGVVLYQLLSKGAGGGVSADYGGASNGTGASEDASDFASLSQAAAEIAAEKEQEEKERQVFQEQDRIRASGDIDTLKIRLMELVPRLQDYLEEIIRSWCHMGDAGRLRLACFAEAAGKETGKLPIPIDALPEVQKVFARMTEISTRDKRDALERAYWDLLSTLNLGTDSLSTPFAYLDGLNLNMVNKVLMEQNPKLRTVVSLYMNNDLRARYLKSLPVESKKEILMMAAGLSEIRAEELESLDRGLMHKLNPTREQELVPLEMSFNKIVASLTPSEEVVLLAELKGEAIEDYKRTFGSLAFLAEWPDEKLQILMMGITPDELVSFLRIRPDMKDRLIGLASMMVAEIGKDELSRPDKSSAQEKDKAIEFFSQRLKGLVEQSDINLMEVFGPRKDVTSVSQLGASDGDGKRAA